MINGLFAALIIFTLHTIYRFACILIRFIQTHSHPKTRCTFIFVVVAKCTTLFVCISKLIKKKEFKRPLDQCQ